MELAPFDEAFTEDAVCALYITAEALREDREEAEERLREARERY